MQIVIQGVEFWASFVPALLALTALGALVLDMTFFRGNPRAVGIFSLAGVIVTAAALFLLHAFRLGGFEPSPFIAFGGELFFDAYSVYFNYLFLAAIASGIILSLLHFANRPEHRAEYYIILLISGIGMSLMASASDLIVLFIGLETMSISVYLLAAAEKRDPRSGEAAIKYLLLGSVASAIFLYGLALVYGFTGEVNFRAVSFALGDMLKTDASVPLMIGIIMTLVGFLFKVAAVPFHMWTPDAYEGAPTPITAVMATAIKAAAFAGLIRLSITAFSSLWGIGSLYATFYVVAVATMLLGNFVAIAQQNLKRMLAYSSIAHAGYLMVGLTAVVASGQFIYFAGDDGFTTAGHAHQAASAMLFYLLIYTVMNIPAFGVLAIVAREKHDETMDAFAGLAGRRPMMAAVMAVCMLSLAGVPPLAGFGAKLFIFQAAVSNRLYILAVIGVLASVVSAYYYLRVIVVMYMQPERIAPAVSTGFSGTYFINMLGGALLILLGLFPQPVLNILIKVFDQSMIDLSIH